MLECPRTTCVACVVQNGYAYWAHAGDSRLYVLRAGSSSRHRRTTRRSSR
jgi:serine/threonine protein phosphatase PrpC